MFKKVIYSVMTTLVLVVSTFAQGSTFVSSNLQMGASKNVYAKDSSPRCKPPVHPDENNTERDYDREYLNAIERTAAMVSDHKAQNLAAKQDLNIVNLTWEDTGRYYNSSVGPNISDVTIQVQHMDPRTCESRLTLMPVIRFPNFNDLTADIPLDKFYLLVGNETGQELHRVSLREYLGNFRQYLSEPDSWRGRENSLLAKRDSHVIVSAQAAFLPVPDAGLAQFNPVIFNYQSYQSNPAVLTIVATREGTSATIIDNVRDAFPAGFSWGQRLFFNQDGERASFTGERLSDFRFGNEPSRDTPQGSSRKGLNMVMIIQVPLKQWHPPRQETMLTEEAEMGAAESMAMATSDVEAAVIGHGEVEGPFTEIDGLRIERDQRFPIRVTVQFYKATSNGKVSPDDMKEIEAQIDKVYSNADYVGSLVVDGQSERPTEYDGQKIEPDEWWSVFWGRFRRNNGFDRYDVYELWRNLEIDTGWWGEFY